jgi:hypothetical protein
MTIFEWVVGGGILGIVAFILGNAREQEKKISRIYERLDETKASQESTYTRKDVCMVLHKQIADSLDEIKIDLKSLIRNGHSK